MTQAMKYGLWGPEEKDVAVFKELLQKGSVENKKVLVLLGFFLLTKDDLRLESPRDRRAAVEQQQRTVPPLV